jgi:hypothetical protein
MATIINRQRDSADIVAIRGVSGGNGLIFYTAPGVRTIDPDTDRSFVQTVCSADTVFLVTRLADVGSLAALAQRIHHRVRSLSANGRTVLLRVDGARCPDLAARR